MPNDEREIVSELYRRRDSLDPEKRAIVEELASRHGLTDSYVSKPNPTGQPLGEDIPTYNTLTQPYDMPTLAGELAGNTWQMAKDVATDPRTWAMTLARRVPAGALAMGAGESVRQIGQHITGSPDAPKDSTDATLRIMGNAGLGAAGVGVFKGAAAIDTMLAKRAALKAQGPLNDMLRVQQELSRQELMAQRHKTALELLQTRRNNQNEKLLMEQTAEQMKGMIQQDQSIKARAVVATEAPKFGPATDFPKKVGTLIQQRAASMSKAVSGFYQKFEATPEAQQSFPTIDLKQIAAEISANTNAISTPPIVMQIKNMPDEIPLHLAEAALSKVKAAAAKSGLFANQSQFVSRRIADKLDGQIEELLASTPGGVQALNYLKIGRALHKFKKGVFESGEDFAYDLDVPVKVSNALRGGGDPIWIAKNDVEYRAFVRQAGAEGIPILRRKLWDTTADTSINPQTGEFMPDKWAGRFNQFRHLLTDEQKAIGDGLASGNPETMLTFERETAKKLLELKRAGQDMTRALQIDKDIKMQAIGAAGRKKRMDISNSYEAPGFNAAEKALMFAAGTALGGSSMGAARSAGVRAMFDYLSLKK